MRGWHRWTGWMRPQTKTWCCEYHLHPFILPKQEGFVKITPPFFSETNGGKYVKVLFQEHGFSQTRNTKTNFSDQFFVEPFTLLEVFFRGETTSLNASVLGVFWMDSLPLLRIPFGWFFCWRWMGWMTITVSWLGWWSWVLGIPKFLKDAMVSSLRWLKRKRAILGGMKIQQFLGNPLVLQGWPRWDSIWSPRTTTSYMEHRRCTSIP